MGIEQMEELLGSVKKIVKILECPICLDLLKVPVSAGCGHFFCKDCANGVLQKSYRAPCPMCKRSFTRRSVQEGVQRQTIISRVEKLARTCSSLTGVDLITPLSVTKTRPLSDSSTSSSKKLKATLEVEDEVNPSRKRKSCDETDIQDKAAAESNKENDKDNPETNLTKDDSTANKRICQASDDSDELPSLEQLFPGNESFKELSFSQTAKNESPEKPLMITPAVKFSTIKTYSRRSKCGENASVSCIPDSFEKVVEQPASSSPVASNQNLNSDNGQDSDANEINEQLVEMNKEKNKIHPLKNKTNKVSSEDLILQEDGFLIKSSPNKLGKGKVNADPVKTKENICEKSARKESEFVNPLPSRRTKKRGRKSNIDMKRQSTEKDVTNKNANEDDHPSNINDCYTVDEIRISPQKDNDKNGNLANAIDDPMLGLIDTAVSVGTVLSPRIAKSAKLDKSPGWSRVKKVEQDFKAKQYSVLNVEKNSPSLVPKSNKKLDSTKECITVISNETSESNAANHVSESLNDADNETEESYVLGKNVEKELVVMGVNNSQNSNNSQISNNSQNSINSPCLAIKMKERRYVSSSAPPIMYMGSTQLSSIERAKNNQENFLSKNIEVSRSFNEIPVSNINRQVFQYSNTDESISMTVENNSVIERGLILDNNKHIADCNCAEQMYKMAEEKRCLNLVAMEEDESHFVEHSQQTSQRLLDPYNDSLLKNKLALLAQQEAAMTARLSSAKKYSFAPKKTKVVKKTCFTLDEIQDYFSKSNDSGCTEVMYSAPFMLGQFKLQIDVAEETLNISVLKVMDEIPQNSSFKSFSLCPGNPIQTSFMYNPIPFETVLPSSNAESESEQPDNPSKADPFPYLNKLQNDFQNLNTVQNQSNHPTVLQSNSDNHSSTVVLNPIDHQSPTTQQTGTENLSVKSKTCNADLTKVNVDLNTAEENNLDESEIIHFPSNESAKLSIQIPEDQQLKESMSIENPQMGLKEDLVVDPSVPSSCKVNKNSQNKSETPAKSLEVSQPLCSSPKDPISTPLKSNDVDNLEFSDSDVDTAPLRTLKEMSGVNLSKQSKESRLSLKSRKKLRRIQVYDSSDESDAEDTSKNISTMSKPNFESGEIEQRPSSVSPKVVKETTPAQVSEGIDMSSTCNSILSEDTNENPSLIVGEIADLSEKIRLLEEKLKECGHVEKQTPVKNSTRSRKKPSGNFSGIVIDSDSSDSSNDLFSQSVPPTP